MPHQSPREPDRELLRHALATVAYRGGKALAGAPEEFARYKASETTRTPQAILAHLGDLFDWALSIARGAERWHACDPLPWREAVDRFFASLQEFDAYLASEEPLHGSVDKLFQGPVADALTHVGQIALLRRMAGAPVKAESYFAAEIVAGRLGPEQALPKFEFD